jgi:hypothetical protein
MVFFVVIFMQHPQKTVHDVFVTKPGYAFHKNKSGQKNKDKN